MKHRIVCESGSYHVPDISQLAEFVMNLIDRTVDAAYGLHRDGEIVVGFLYNGEHATVFRDSDGAEPFNRQITKP